MQWVLIRGIVSERFHWGRFTSQISERFPGHKIEAADILGNGITRDRLTPLRIKLNINGLREQVSPGSKKVLLGFSLGGMLALEWAHRHPEEVAGVVLINISLSGVSVTKRLRPQALKTIIKSAFQKDPIVKEEMILKMTTAGLPEEKIKELAKDWGDYGRKNPAKVINFISQLGLAAQINQRKAPPSKPILILTSQNDGVVDPECSHQIAKRWRIAPVIHPTAGHDLTLNDPDWTLEQIEKWLKNWSTNHPPMDLTSQTLDQPKGPPIFP